MLNLPVVGHGVAHVGGEQFESIVLPKELQIALSFGHCEDLEELHSGVASEVLLNHDLDQEGHVLRRLKSLVGEELEDAPLDLQDN